MVWRVILTVDIGNSDIMLGGFECDEPTFVARISTDSTKTEDEYACKILNVLSLYDIEKTKVTGAIISSVVPPLNSVIKNAIRLTIPASFATFS